MLPNGIDRVPETTSLPGRRPQARRGRRGWRPRPQDERHNGSAGSWAFQPPRPGMHFTPSASPPPVRYIANPLWMPPSGEQPRTTIRANFCPLELNSP